MSIIPAPVVDQQDILLRAAINKLKTDEFYDVDVIDKKALGVGFKPVDNWAVVKDFDGYLVEFVEHHEGTRPGVPDPKKVG